MQVAVFSYGSKEETLYEISRSIYRQLAPHVSGSSPAEVASNRNELLREAEQALERLCSDPFSAANPTRSLFRSIRPLFPLARQREVYVVVERHVNLACLYVEIQAQAGRAIDGGRLRCGSDTRKGRPCARTPLPGHRYCPSHQHLEESAELRIPA